MKVIAPVRNGKWSREEEIAHAAEKGKLIPADLDNPYSIDQKSLGRACECGLQRSMGDFRGAYAITEQELEDTPDVPFQTLRLLFDRWIPTPHWMANTESGPN